MRVYRASSLGYSLEALVAPHLGFVPVDPPEFLQKAYDEGTRIEPLALAKLKERGWQLYDEQLEVTIPDILPGVAVVGHLDATGHPAGLSWGVVEIKSMAAKAWESFEKHGWDAPGLVQKYKWQASAYMIATNKPHYMVAWNKESEELAIEYVKEPFFTREDIAGKLELAEGYIASGLVPDGCTDFPCSYFYLHDQKADTSVEADEELEELLEVWQKADRVVKAGEATRKAYRQKIIDAVAAKAETLTASKIKSAAGVTVTTTWVDGKHVEYDTEAHWETRIQGPRAK